MTTRDKMFHALERFYDEQKHCAITLTDEQRSEYSEAIEHIQTIYEQWVAIQVMEYHRPHGIVYQVELYLLDEATTMEHLCAVDDPLEWGIRYEYGFPELDQAIEHVVAFMRFALVR